MSEQAQAVFEDYLKAWYILRHCHMQWWSQNEKGSSAMTLLEQLAGTEVPPHLNPLRMLADLNYGAKASTSQAALLLRAYDTMKLEPEHVGEVAEGLELVSSQIKKREKKYSPVVGGLITKRRAAFVNARKPVSQTPAKDGAVATVPAETPAPHVVEQLRSGGVEPPADSPQ